MPDAETFDAFYARTVWNVTSQMHALAEGDGAALGCAAQGIAQQIGDDLLHPARVGING